MMTTEPTAPDAPRIAGRRQWTLLGLALGAVLLIFVIIPFVASRLAAAPPPPDKTPAVTFQATDREWAGLRFARAAPQAFQGMITTDGKLAGDDNLTTQVFSPYTGRVTRIFAVPGERVTAGTPLFAVAAQEFVQGQSDLSNAVAGLKAARAQLTAAEAAEARQHDLYNHQGAALKDWQQSQVDLANAQSGMRGADNALSSARARLRILGASDADVARLSGPNAGAGETIVRSPVAGVVTERGIGIGQNVSSVASGGGGTAAFTVSDFSRIWAVAYLREDDAMAAHVGQRALVRLLARPQQPIEVRIDYVSPTLDPNTRRVTIRATLPNADQSLKPELYATISLLTGGDRSAISVPQSAVLYEGSAAHVWVAQPRGRRIGLRAITTGVTTPDGRVEVLTGLRPGELVVTTGALFIDRAAKADGSSGE